MGKLLNVQYLLSPEPAHYTLFSVSCHFFCIAIFARSSDSVGLDPVDESDLESVMVCAQIMEPLVTFEPGTTTIIPALAERWEVSDDLLTWTFYLRQGVKFHDGSDFDAEAVVFNFERWWDRDNPYHIGHTGNFFHWSFYFRGFKGE
ncbi:MAG: hypothetical protein FJ026_17945 [Chloroflexi bacterium]|nr:hypothetical protein [Chloroflexota bacterium]